MEGVIRTRVGYAGGGLQDPTYENLGDHTESVQIDYDPARISYQALLEAFWSGHDPARRAWSRQYMNAVFYHNPQQRQLAEASAQSLKQDKGIRVHTAILPLTAFYRAEDYHQKYLLGRRSDLARDLERIYPRRKDLVDSTAAARLNGYAGGNGSRAQLEREIGGLGLSPESRRVLEKMVRDSGK